MTNNLAKEKKSEIIVIVITAIFVAFLASFLASFVYAEIKDNSCLKFFIIGAILLVLLAFIFLYKLIMSNVSSKRITSSIPLTFSRKKKAFIDLPFNMLSVQTRVNFNKLPQEGKNHLSTYDKMDDFRNSELNRFVNQSIQSSIISRILYNWKRTQKENKEKIDSSNLPKSIKENLYLKDWLSERGEIFAPHIKKIECFGPNDSFLKVQTKFGDLKFTWRISYHQTPYYSKYFFDDEELKQLIDYHDFLIDLSLDYSVNPWKLFSSNSSKFYEYCAYLENQLSDYDWKSNNLERILLLIKDLKTSKKQKKKKKKK